jgi:hypothetical protein
MVVLSKLAFSDEMMVQKTGRDGAILARLRQRTEEDEENEVFRHSVVEIETSD